MDRNVRDAIRYLKTLSVTDRLLLLFDFDQDKTVMPTQREPFLISQALHDIERIVNLTPEQVSLARRIHDLQNDREGE